ANASHELRTPVSAITGAVETLLSSGKMLDPAARGFVEMIARHADRLSRLTRELLDLSRLERGEFHVELGPVELAPLVATSLDRASSRATARVSSSASIGRTPAGRGRAAGPGLASPSSSTSRRRSAERWASRVAREAADSG